MACIKYSFPPMRLRFIRTLCWLEPSLVFLSSYASLRSLAVLLLAFVTAVLLLNFIALMDSLALTVFNQTSEQSLFYSQASSPGSAYIEFAVYAIATVGIIGLARGLCLIRIA